METMATKMMPALGGRKRTLIKKSFLLTPEQYAYVCKLAARQQLGRHGISAVIRQLIQADIERSER